MDLLNADLAQLSTEDQVSFSHAATSSSSSSLPQTELQRTDTAMFSIGTTAAPSKRKAKRPSQRPPHSTSHAAFSFDRPPVTTRSLFSFGAPSIDAPGASSAFGHTTAASSSSRFALPVTSENSMVLSTLSKLDLTEEKQVRKKARPSLKVDTQEANRGFETNLFAESLFAAHFSLDGPANNVSTTSASTTPNSNAAVADFDQDP